MAKKLSPVTKGRAGSGTPVKKAPTPAKPPERPPIPASGQKPPTPVKKAPTTKPPERPASSVQKPPAPGQKPPTPVQKTPPSAQKPPAPKPGTAPAGYSGLPPEAIAAMKAAQERAQEAQKQAEAQKAQPRTYVVQAGDSLSKIAKKILGDARRWPEIYELNKDQISDPNLIRVGQELKLPAD